jgi:hypothetical protein
MDGNAYFISSVFAHPDPSEYVIDKGKCCENYIDYFILRLLKMFKYENLPDSMPPDMLEYITMMNGHTFVTKVGDDLYALYGTFGGIQDGYYRPTQYIVSNPGLNLTETYDIKEDGVLFRNDFLWKGLYPLLARYAYLMSENLLTIRTADIMLRIIAMISAPDDTTKAAGEAYLQKIVKGELSVIGEKTFLDDGIRMQSPPSNNGSYLTQFIELHQYLKGSCFNELGLNANFNMKREALGDGETSLNDDILMPLCDQMLQCRKEDVAKINAMFDTDITVEFDSSWAQNVKEMELELENMKKEASQLAESGDSNGQSSGDNSEPGTSDSHGNSEQTDDSGSADSDKGDDDNGSGSESLDEHEHDDDKDSGVANDAGSDEDGRGDDSSGDSGDDSGEQTSGDDSKSETDDGLKKEKKDE